jgi:hypothetical protein
MTVPAPLLPFAFAAGELRRQETARLAVPCRRHETQGVDRRRRRFARMLERLGYELLTFETAAELLIMKDGNKSVAAFPPRQ